MRTRITDLLNIQYPIMQGGMHYVGFAPLAGAVSQAGGLGVITALTQRTPELLAREIERTKEFTDKPFGVNISFLPTFAKPPVRRIHQRDLRGRRAYRRNGRA